MLNLILFGPPGSGKGTQAAKLIEKYNLLHISTGDLFRAEIGNGTALGLEAKSYMDKGALVPDSVTVNMLKSKMEQHPEIQGVIFDGFPRTIPQAQALDVQGQRPPGTRQSHGFASCARLTLRPDARNRAAVPWPPRCAIAGQSRDRS